MHPKREKTRRLGRIQSTEHRAQSTEHTMHGIKAHLTSVGQEIGLEEPYRVKQGLRTEGDITWRVRSMGDN